MNSIHIDYLNVDIPVGLNGVIDFPADTKLRDKYMASKSHPAIINLYLLFWLIEHLTKPGDTILDPTSGMGTLMLATLMGRNVVNIELEKHMVENQMKNWEHLCQQFPKEITGIYTLHGGDARRYLPYQANHAIFSPPYSVNISRGGKQVAAMGAESGTFVGEYGQDRAQLSRLSYFNLVIAMKEIYRGLYQSLPVGGFMCTVTKDSVNTKEAKYRGYGGVEPYSADTMKICHEVGFDLYKLYQRDAKPSLRLQIAWSQNPGIPHVQTEEIIIMVKNK
uniref:Putative methyltransferase n=1 Tax=viral metagenome TaxID=1070528 RepID=A0A6H1ZQW1_9ZZZZ